MTIYIKPYRIYDCFAKYTVFRFTVVNIATSVTTVTVVKNVPRVTKTASDTEVMYKDSDEENALKVLCSADIS